MNPLFVLLCLALVTTLADVLIAIFKRPKPQTEPAVRILDHAEYIRLRRIEMMVRTAIANGSKDWLVHRIARELDLAPQPNRDRAS